jgi:hypothetical protein
LLLALVGDRQVIPELKKEGLVVRERQVVRFVKQEVILAIKT